MWMMVTVSKKVTLKKQSGSSMIEVLVSLLIVSFGMLAIASLQLKTVNNNLGQLERSTAIMLTYSMIDRLRIDKATAKAQSYNFEFNTDVNVCDPPDTGSSKARNQTEKWIQEIQANLGEGSCGEVNCSGSGECLVSIRWNDALATEGNAEEVVTTESML
jgi:type IV pilus assembly protein PilV